MYWVFFFIEDTKSVRVFLKSSRRYIPLFMYVCYEIE